MRSYMLERMRLLVMHQNVRALVIHVSVQLQSTLSQAHQARTRLPLVALNAYVPVSSVPE